MPFTFPVGSKYRYPYHYKPQYMGMEKQIIPKTKMKHNPVRLVKYKG